jgi:hypothetical protein
VDEPADDGGQSAFHAGADDEHAGGLERGFLGEEAMDAGDADVGDELDGVAHEAGGDRGFFSNGQVAGAGADDADSSLCPRKQAVWLSVMQRAVS